MHKHIVCILVLLLLLCSGCTFQGTPTKLIEERKQTVFGSGFELTSCEQITEKDIYELCLRIRDKDPEEFDAVMLTNKYHGHIGPNNIYGVKMALYAKKLLDGKNSEISVVSEAGTEPPLGCLNDGIMPAIGATLGRGLITVLPDSKKLAASFFYKEKSVRLEMRPDKLEYSKEFIAKALDEHGGLTEDYFKDVRGAALYVWENYDQDDMFIVSYYPDDHEFYCEYNKMNINNYFSRLHNSIHSVSTEQEILDIIEKDSCVRDGFIEKNESVFKVGSVWKSNDEVLVFDHSG